MNVGVMTRIGVLAAALAVSGCAKKEESKTSSPTVVKVEIVSGGVGRADGARYSASIEPDVQVDLAFKVGGYVEEIASITGADGRRRLLQEGDRVTKGTVLARVRDGEYRDRVTEAKSVLTRAKADYERAAQLYENRNVSKADYDAALAQMTGAQARFDQAQSTLADCSLQAPLGGVVMKRDVEVGTLVSPGVPAFMIADTKAVKAIVGVPDMVVSSLSVGQKQTVTAEAVPGTQFAGTITRVSPSADATSRMFEVEITIPNEEGKLKSGMIAAVGLGSAATAAAAAQPTVAMNAVVRPTGETEGYAVFVVEDDGPRTVAHARRVELGDVVGSRVQVGGGLSGGERVIVEGASQVADGQEVRVVP